MYFCAFSIANDTIQYKQLHLEFTKMMRKFTA